MHRMQRNVPGAPSRRAVMRATAATAAGISTHILPSAAAASTIVTAARSGFIQIDELAAADVGGTNPTDDVFRSFTYNGVLYFLDLGSWKVFEFSGALVSRVVTITGVPAGSWSGGYVSNVVLAGSQAFISTLHDDGDKLVVVRLGLPLASTSVAATTQTIDLSGRLGTVDLASESWTVDDSGTAVTISGTDLIDGSISPFAPGWPSDYYKSTVTFDSVGVEPVLVHDGTNLRCMIELSVQSGADPYYLRQASPQRYWILDIRPVELVTIPPSLSGAATFALVGRNLEVRGWSGGGSAPGDPTTNVRSPSSIVVHRSGDLIALHQSNSSASLATRIPLATPASQSTVTSVSLPTGLSDFRVETSWGNFLRIGDLLYVAARVEVEEAGVPTSRTGVLRIDLSQSGLPVTAYGVVPDSDSNPSGLIAADASYLYVGYYAPVTPWPFGVARFDLSTLSWDASALVELENSADHYGYTAQVASSAVVSAGGGTVAFTTFGFVAPS